VAAKIDVNAIAQRLDLEAFLARVDMVKIATELIEQLDLAQLIREASRDTASDGVRTVRLRGVDADRAIRRAVDRVLGRDDHSEHA
jgi:hypothetical protein